MSRKRYEYQFPEKDAFRAMELTEPEFNILEKGYEKKLYVDVSSVRSREFVQRMKFRLGRPMRS